MKNPTSGRVPTRKARSLAAAALLLLAAAGCATPIGVREVGVREAYDELHRSALSGNEPSWATVELLHRLDLSREYERSPAQAIADLHQRLLAEPSRDVLFALAELCSLHGQRTGSRPYLLASAVYAWAFLFPGDVLPPVGELDPRMRASADLYNRGITEGFASVDRSEVKLDNGRYELPFGTLVVERDPAGFQWGGRPFERFLPLLGLEVYGFSSRYPRSGLGAPLGALTANAPASIAARRVARRMEVPVSALLRIADPFEQLRGGEVSARLELYALQDTHTTVVDGQTVTLQYDPTAALARTLERGNAWSYELGAFLGRTPPFAGLWMLVPYHPGRVPVVLVHGTASSPARWAELVNDLMGDPEISDHIQIWIFGYDTGNPLVYSGMLLRQALNDTVEELDPDGKDPALHDMVVIGHSQGGLLTKLTAVDSGTSFWDALSSKPFDQVKLKPDQRELLRAAFFFQAVPSVKTVVFISTPHHGSYLASSIPRRLAASLVSLPRSITSLMTDLVTLNPDAFDRWNLSRPRTSLDAMAPGNPALEVLASLPLAPGVTAHSIIAVNSDAPLDEAVDGVVAYRSAHIEGVESELIVRSGHSCQDKPATINEVKRILREHLGL